MIETTEFSETSAYVYQTTRRHIYEYGSVNSSSRQDFRYYDIWLLQVKKSALVLKFCGRNVNVAAFRCAIENKCMPSGSMLIAFAVDRNSTVNLACRNAVVFVLQIFCLSHLFVLHTISIKIVCFVDGL
jgi:hypothetical protein